VVKEQKEALVFTLKYDRYDPAAIQEYFTKLIGSTLKYVIVEDAKGDFDHMGKGEFVGMIEFTKLAQQLLRTVNSGFDTHDITWFYNIITSGNSSELNLLNGFISKENAATLKDSRAEVLGKMTELKAEYLPVITSDNKFKGVVTQSRLNSVILLDLYAEVKGKNKQP